MATINIKITDGADDGQYEYNFGPTCNMTGTSVRVGTVAFHVARYHGGFRFQNVAIPKDSVITAATITVYITSISGTPNFTITAEKVANADAWSATCVAGDRPGSMGTLTTASTSPSVSGAGQKAFDIKTIIQELVDQTSWAENNNLRLQFFNNDTSSDSVNILIEAEELSVPTFGAAELDVTFTPPEYIPMVHVIESVDLRDGSPNVFRSWHEGDGGNYNWEEGFCGVKASLAADAAVYLRFQKLGDTLPSGTPYVMLYGLADAVSNYIDVELFWAAIAAGEKPSAGALNTEGINRLTWAAGDDHDYKKTEWALNVVTAPVANDVVVVKLVFKSTSTLAARSTWKGWLDHH